MSEVLRAAVIGHPIAHSRSPELFARFAAASGIALAYEAIDVAPAELAATLARWRTLPEFVGCNVTLPHKERALALADRAEPAARACGAANVLTRDGDALVAGNTDVAGVEAALAQHGVALRGARVAIMGAGGAARAVAEAARRSGAARITVAARNLDRATAVAADFGALACALDDVPRADVYVNATPVGMQDQPQHSVLPPNAPRDATAFDLVYVPEDTPFLIDARARGLRTIAGTTMFVAQAAATFERWFGSSPAVGDWDEFWRTLRPLSLSKGQGDRDPGSTLPDCSQSVSQPELQCHIDLQSHPELQCHPELQSQPELQCHPDLQCHPELVEGCATILADKTP